MTVISAVISFNLINFKHIIGNLCKFARRHAVKLRFMGHFLFEKVLFTSRFHTESHILKFRITLKSCRTKYSANIIGVGFKGAAQKSLRNPTFMACLAQLSMKFPLVEIACDETFSDVLNYMIIWRNIAFHFLIHIARLSQYSKTIFLLIFYARLSPSPQWISLFHAALFFLISIAGIFTSFIVILNIHYEMAVALEPNIGKQASNKIRKDVIHTIIMYLSVLASLKIKANRERRVRHSINPPIKLFNFSRVVFYSVCDRVKHCTEVP